MITTPTTPYPDTDAVRAMLMDEIVRNASDMPNEARFRNYLGGLSTAALGERLVIVRSQAAQVMPGNLFLFSLRGRGVDSARQGAAVPNAAQRDIPDNKQSVGRNTLNIEHPAPRRFRR